MRGRTIVMGVALAVVALGLAAPPASAATIAVHCPTQNLQTKINSAAPGSTLSITGTCHVNATINKNITLQGNPTATLDGDDLGSTITISGTPSVHLTHLVVTGGRSSQGGGIDITSGTVTLLHVTVQDNLAEGTSAQGGGIRNAGTLKVLQSTIAHNRAAAAANGGPANGDGGGINSTGSLTVSGSTISSNRATANATGGGGGSFGGGILEEGGSLTVTASHFAGNHTETTGDTLEPTAGGGAIADVSSGKTATITGTTFDQNAVVLVGHGGVSSDAVGGALLFGVKTATVKSSTFTGNSVASTSDGDAEADGGAINAIMTAVTLSGVTVRDSTASAQGAGSVRAFGGGMYLQGTASVTGSSIEDGTADAEGGANQTLAVGAGIAADPTGTKLTVARTTIAGNHTIARSGSATPNAFGGGILSETSTAIKASTVSGNTATAIDPSGSAAAEGGGMDLLEGTDTLTNSTVAGNHAKATASGTGVAAALGGGIETTGTITGLTIVAGTVARNEAEGSGGTLGARGGGLRADSGTVTLHGTVLALNTAPTSSDGPNCSGAVAIGSAGHNLLGTTSGCTFTKQTSDLINKPNPGLGALANNGGSTETIALTSTSLARNAFAKPCVTATDQRGVHRPQGTRCDIGAFERA
ncbi:MAG TPA: choice-of-anchor Q domain-containing protein [Actinomycetota bacterium]